MREDQIADVERRIAERREVAKGMRERGKVDSADAVDADTDMMHALVTEVKCLTYARDALRGVVHAMGGERRAAVAEEKAREAAAQAERRAKKSKGASSVAPSAVEGGTTEKNDVERERLGGSTSPTTFSNHGPGEMTAEALEAAHESIVSATGSMATRWTCSDCGAVRVTLEGAKPTGWSFGPYAGAAEPAPPHCEACTKAAGV